MKKRIISVLLAAALVVTALPPTNVVAKEQSGTFESSTKVVGSNGIEYDDVAYLSEKTYNSLPEDYQEVYVNMCDSIADMKEIDSGINSVVISVNENKELVAQWSIPGTFLQSVVLQEQFMTESEPSEDQESTISEAPTASIPEESNPSVVAITDGTSQNTPSDAITDGTSQDGLGDAITDGTSQDTPGDAITDGTSQNTPGDAITDGTSQDTPGNAITDGTSQDTPGDAITDGTSQDTPGDAITDGTSQDTPNDAITDGTSQDTPGDAITDGTSQDTPGDAITDETSQDNSEAISAETVVENPNETSNESIENADEISESFAEETAENSLEEAEEDVAEAEETSAQFFMENTELASALEVQEDEIEGIESVEYDTILQNMSFFKKQLTSSEQKIYDTMKKSLVTKKKTSFSYSFSGMYYSSLHGREMINALNAVINTYPNSFNYIQRGASNVLSGRWSYRYGKTTISGNIKKSKYYSKSLESDAKSKVKTLVKEAYDYAAAKYPNDPTYGICYYFNDWICRNNYYNMDGTYQNMVNTATYFYCHTCYGILLKGYGVCESYALAMSRLLDAAGIRNLYVTGDAGGGHAWNYVQMPDGKWYLLDSTWNDDGTNSSTYYNTNYFLSKNYYDRTDEGILFLGGKTFSFEPLASTNYARVNESANVSIDKSIIVMKPKKTATIKVNVSASKGYYNKYKFSWKSDNTSVAKVSSKGKVTAGKTAGEATITMKLGGIERSCKVCVYKLSKLTFANAKASLSETVNLADGAKAIPITVKQSNQVLTASQIASFANLKATVSSSNKKIADGSAIITGDTIILSVTPKKAGTAKLKVKFGGKTATYTIKVKK